ncbi:MAG TPA: hypothetical protein PLZ84_05175, partial [Clostridia bacterium]|nr:hypothetical protein [Clostridia bacterium]
TPHTWDFNGSLQGWGNAYQISNLTESNGCMEGTITGTDPYVFSADYLGIDLSSRSIVRIRMKNSTSATTADIYFTTNESPSFGDEKKVSFNIIANDDGYTEYVIDMSVNAYWTGTLKRFRLDPNNWATSGTFSVDYIDITSS